MIQSISGKLKARGDGFVVVDAHGIGFRVFILDGARGSLPKIGEPVDFFTYFQVREDAWNLYGFLIKEELDFFEKLITVSGVGPKSAMNVMAVASTDRIVSAIASGETELLQKVSGIGKKTAERIILELKDKLVGGSKETLRVMESDSDVYEALKSMGYNQRQAKDAIAKVSPEVSSTSERLKEALKIIKG